MAKPKNIRPFDEDDSNKARGVRLAKNVDPGNFYRRKAKMDAVNDMSGDDFAPKDGKKILDRLLNKKNKKKGKA